MRTIKVPCAGCGADVVRLKGEWNRSQRLGRRTFCSSSCGATTANAPRRSTVFDMTCPCGKWFSTTTRNKAARHCSRRCASLYSITEARLEAWQKTGADAVANKLGVLTDDQAKRELVRELALRGREKPRYAEVQARLNAAGIRHEVEVSIGNFVYDLVLLDARVIVEFDGPYHDQPRAEPVDTAKDANAAAFGYGLRRVRHAKGVYVFPASLLDSVI